MREILFRAKRLDNGEWVEGYFKHSETNEKAMIADGAFYWHEVDPLTLGQFTGLLDKNGKKIFEGDIVKHKTAPFGCPVVFLGGAFRLGNGIAHTLLNRLESAEVIGTIHDKAVNI